MHILLLILKIIGIILLILLGIVLLLIVLLVFVPFCYRAEGSYYEDKPYAMARVRFLFPLLHVFIRYQDGEAEGKVKLFGITVYDLLAPKESAVSDTVSQDMEADEENSTDGMSVTTDTAKERNMTEENETVEAYAMTESPNEETEPLSFLEKIRKFLAVLSEKIQALLQKLKELKIKGIRAKEKAEETAEKIRYYYCIWQREETQRAFQTAKRTLYRLWKSIRPKKGLVKLHFGTGDPGSTGQMCGYFGMMYPFLGKYVMIEPDFEQKIYEGDFYFKGRLTVFAFLKVVWVVLFDKDIKKLRKILIKKKEESYE